MAQAGAVASDWRRWLLLFVVTCGAEALVLGAVAARRAVNADEGFYLNAAWQVLAGHHLYADFFFPQMPYLPYAQAAALSLAGPSLLAGRVISVAAGALLAGLLAVAGARRSGAAGVGIVMALAYAGNALVLSYVPVAKTYGLANLALVGAFLLLAAPGAGLLQAVAAGACAGLAVGARLPTAAVVAVLLVWSAWRGMRYGLAFAAGALFTSLPWLWIAARDPQSFWFCNFGFHGLRREITGVAPILQQKAVILAKWVLVPQNLLLWALVAAGCVMRPRQAMAAAACAAALGAVYLWATPTYLEYFVQIVPFMLLAATPALAALLPRRGLLAVVASLYLVGLIAARRAAPDESVRGSKARLWQLSTVTAVTDYLREHSRPDDRILSWWEGYPFLARRAGFTGVGFWESNVAKKLSAETRRRFHVLDNEDVRQLVVAREPRLVVFTDGTWEGIEEALDENYRPAARFGSILVFGRRDHGAAESAPSAAPG
jgi:hypothetical protein